ncbi:TIGR04140 family protein [Thermococcus sp.]|uniref:TIGR04140 family protein n=1 Tax=Thermococcus sp. TaxID=35749 RepID=UPI0025D63E6F|nr:TIGR04140 family protein [Thermococcus sp.]
MKRTLITAIPPDEVREISLKSGAEVKVEVREGKPIHGMPRWEIVVEGKDEEVRRFMLSLMKSRAGG